MFIQSLLVELPTTIEHHHLLQHFTLIWIVSTLPLIQSVHFRASLLFLKYFFDFIIIFIAWYKEEEILERSNWRGYSLLRPQDLLHLIIEQSNSLHFSSKDLTESSITRDSQIKSIHIRTLQYFASVMRYPERYSKLYIEQIK